MTNGPKNTFYLVRTAFNGSKKSPYFFHAESADRMEIRSAGPDERIYSEDDIVGY